MHIITPSLISVHTAAVWVTFLYFWGYSNFAFYSPLKLQITLWCYLCRPTECPKSRFTKIILAFQKSKNILTTTRSTPTESRNKRYKLFQFAVHDSSANFISPKHWYSNWCAMLFLCFSYISHGFFPSFAKRKNVSFWTLLYYIPWPNHTENLSSRKSRTLLPLHISWCSSISGIIVSWKNSRQPFSVKTLSMKEGPMPPSAQMSARIVTLLSQDVVYCRPNTHSCIDLLFRFSWMLLHLSVQPSL
jgi:hypothetical protein